jgi:ribonucleoside-triphosphate reductase
MKALSNHQVKNRLDFIRAYTKASNASSGSEVDANANVTRKTLATLEAEVYKPYTIALNRQLVTEKLRGMFGWEVAEHYLTDLDYHFIYAHDETSLKPYCASITLYPFLLEGTKCMGGVSKAPKNLQSFCGSFVNLVYQVASNFAGAVATVEFLHYFDYFARKQYGKNYLKTNAKEVKQELQGVVYGLNQPASARGDQSVFWNISVFDRPYMQEMFGNFYYPDGTQPNMDSLMELQKFFMEWFRKERHKELLTYPVLTASILTDGKGGFCDPEFMEFCAEQMSKGHSFFVYMSDSVDSLASCCRLRNELADNTFSYTLGAGGIVTGSAQVITLNLNRLAELAIMFADSFDDVLREQIQDVHKYLLASKAIYKDYIKAGLLPAYTAGFMDIDKQFLTLGINGLVEAAENYGYTIGNNEKYKKWLSHVLGIFKEENKKALQQYGCHFNTELVPAENLGVKNAKWDKEDGYWNGNRDCYNSYFYRVEDTNLNVLDKIEMYAHDVTDSLDGGSALHLNLEQLPSYEQAKTLFKLCSKNGVPYWTTNVLCTICNDCGTIDPVTRKACKKCGSENVDYGTRVIGYLKRITNFSDARQVEAAKRYYAKPKFK